MSPELLIMQETYELNSFLRIGFGDEAEVVRVVGHSEDGVWVVGEYDDPQSSNRQFIKFV